MLKRDIFLMLLFLSLIIVGSLVYASTPAVVSSPFHYSFSSDGILQETGSQQESSSPYWWLNSGAKLIISNGTGKTIQKELGSNDKWRLLYLYSNPIDTDKGYHPQNIFRLI